MWQDLLKSPKLALAVRQAVTPDQRRRIRFLVQRLRSSSQTPLLEPGPLRTVRMRFPIYSSSLSKTCCKQIRQLPVGHMQLPVAVRVQKSQIVPVVGAAFCAVNHVMHMPSRLASERFFTCWTSTVLRLP